MNNIIIFKTNAFPTISETFIVYNIVETLKKGYDVKIIVDTINPETNTSQPNLLEQYGLMDKIIKFNQPTKKYKRCLKAIYILLNPLLFFYFIKYTVLKRKISLTYIFILYFYLEFRKTKVFHVHFATAINPLFELKQIGFLSSKIVVTFHGYDANSLPNGKALNKLIQNFNSFVFKITVNSEFLKTILVSKGFRESKIILVPIGIDMEFFKSDLTLKVARPTFKLITIGRLVALKGQEYGIRVTKILIDKGFSVRYTIVGDGTDLDKLVGLTKIMELEDYVTFTGNSCQQEIKQYLLEHDVFLMTSTVNESGTREAFGVVSLEAQAMGLPVIGFESGGFPETVVDNETGFIVEDQNFFSMADAIEKFILDEDLFITMSVNARNHILRTYSFEKTTEQYLKLYI